MDKEIEQSDLPLESQAEQTAPAPKKKTARKGRPKKLPESQSQADSAPVPDSEDDEVRIAGVPLEASKDAAAVKEDADGDAKNEGNSGHDRQDNRQQRNPRRGQAPQNKKGRNDHGKNQRNDHKKKGKGNQQSGNAQRNKRQKGRHPRQQRNMVSLLDGGQAIASGLELGDLGSWEALSRIDEIHALCSEFSENTLDFDALYALSLPELREKVAANTSLKGTPNRWQALRALMDAAAAEKSLLKVSGILEVLADENGLLVFAADSYCVKATAVFIPRAFIKEYGLKRGHSLEVLAHAPRDEESAPYALKVNAVNGMPPQDVAKMTPFTELVPYYPLERMLLETNNEMKWDNTSMRVVDLLTPIGLGQRGLIVAPPRTGKTVLMQGMANAIAENRPDIHLIILLVDERPEEVTDFRRNCRGEVIASTFDEDADSHAHASEVVIEKSRRMVECGKDVVILLDSITRLARAYNTLMPNSGKILSGGVEANAMQIPKRFFGSARNIEDGGSLTIIATALVDTGSRMDEVIFEEFKGTGNMELHLDRSLVDKRTFPALSFEKSGTRKEELLYHADEMNKIYSLRRAMKGVPSTEAMEMLIQRVKKTNSNAEFLMTMSR